MSRPVQLSDGETVLHSAAAYWIQRLSLLGFKSALSKECHCGDDRIGPATATPADTERVERLGGTTDNYEPGGGGLDLTQKMANSGLGLIQFCFFAKTDVDNRITGPDYAQMDRVLREEGTCILNLAKHSKETGCDVLLVQGSTLRGALSDLASRSLNQTEIMMVNDIEREDTEFL